MLELPVLTPGTQLHTCAVECGAKCCHYVAVPIDTPRSNADFDDVRWYLMHEGMHVYKYEGVWHLLSESRCRHLLPNNVCGAYEKRPKVCEDYDPGSCEHVGDVAYDLYFRDDAELETWLAARKARRSAAARRRRAPRK